MIDVVVIATRRIRCLPASNPWILLRSLAGDCVTYVTRIYEMAGPAIQMNLKTAVSNPQHPRVRTVPLAAGATGLPSHGAPDLL